MFQTSQPSDGEILLCSNYASKGFSCVTKDNCPDKSLGRNSNVFPRGDESLDQIFREEIEENAQCPEKRMICCNIEDILIENEDNNDLNQVSYLLKIAAEKNI